MATGRKKTGSGEPDQYETIFVKHFFHKGLKRRIFAHQYGLEAFALKVKRKAEEGKLKPKPPKKKKGKLDGTDKPESDSLN